MSRLLECELRHMSTSRCMRFPRVSLDDRKQLLTTDRSPFIDVCAALCMLGKTICPDGGDKTDTSRVRSTALRKCMGMYMSSLRWERARGACGQISITHLWLRLGRQAHALKVKPLYLAMRIIASNHLSVRYLPAVAVPFRCCCVRRRNIVDGRGIGAVILLATPPGALRRHSAGRGRTGLAPLRVALDALVLRNVLVELFRIGVDENQRLVREHHLLLRELQALLRPLLDFFCSRRQTR